MNRKNTAILVVDMLNDFVNGYLKCERAKMIIPKLVQLLDCARNLNVPVIFCNDNHLPNIDHELKLWGNHAIKGTWGAEVIQELNKNTSDYEVLKHSFSGFFKTDLEIILKSLNIKNVILTGLQTHICVAHTASDAYCLGFDVTLALDATTSFTSESYVNAINYMKEIYGINTYSVDKILYFLNI